MYSPKIREEYVRAMYQIKQQTGISITKQANRAIEEYLEKNNSNSKQKQISISKREK